MFITIIPLTSLYIMIEMFINTIFIHHDDHLSGRNEVTV